MARPQMTDEQILDVLYQQVDDPDRNPTFDSELQREIKLVQDRIKRAGGQPPVKPQQKVQLVASKEPPDFENKNPEVNSDLFAEFGLKPEELKQGVAGGDLLQEFNIDAASLEKAGPTMGDRFKAAGENVQLLLNPVQTLTDGKPLIRGEVLKQAPGEIVPGAAEMVAASSAMLSDQEQAELGKVRQLITRMNSSTPPTPAELGMIASTKGRYYISEAINAQGDTAKFEAILKLLDDERSEAGKSAQVARDVASSYAADFAERTPKDVGFAEQALLSASRSIGPSLAAAGLSAVNPAAAIALGTGFMTLGAAGDSYLKAEEMAAKRGVEITPEHKMRFAALDGLFEGIGEATSLKIALKAGLPFFERVAKAVVGESSSEAATAVMQKANEFLQINPEMTAKEFAYEVALSATAGAMGGSAMAAAAHSAQAIGEAVGEDAQLQRAIEDLIRSDNPQLLPPEEVARRAMDPGGTPSPEEAFAIALRDNPAKAAQLAAEATYPEASVKTAQQLVEDGELSDSQFRKFRLEFIKAVAAETALNTDEQVGELTAEADTIEKRLTEIAEVPIDYKPTVEEAQDFELAMNILKTVQQQGLHMGEAVRFALEEARKSKTPLMKTFFSMFSRAADLHGGQNPIYEGADFQIAGKSNPVEYLAIMATRQVQGFYPYSGTFAPSRFPAPEEGSSLLWIQEDGTETDIEALPNNGMGRGMARMRNVERAKSTAATVTKWLKALAPNLRIMVVDRQEAGRFGLAQGGGAGAARPTSKDTGLIYVDDVADEAQFVEVLAHEFGHMLTHHFLHKMPKSVKQALDREYGRDTKRLLKMSVTEAIRQRRGPHGNEYTPGSAYQGTVEENLHRSSFLRGYLLSKEEWVAHQMERLIINGNLDLLPPATSFFKKLVQHLKRFFEKFGSDFAPNKTFEDFIKLGSLRERAKVLQQGGIEAAEMALRAYGISELNHEESAAAQEVIARTMKNVRAAPKIAQAMNEASPDVQQRAAAAIGRLGQVEVSMFVPQESSLPEPIISAEELTITLEDAWLPGQSTNTLRDMLSVSDPQSNNQGLPSAKPAGRIASALRNFYKYSRFGRMIDSSPYEGHLDKYSWFRKQVHSLEHWAKANPHIEQLQRYLTGVREWARDRMAWISRADARLKEWRTLTSNEQKVLGRFLLDQTHEGKYFDLNDPAILAKYPLTARSRDMYNKINSDFQDFIAAVEATLIAQATKRLSGNVFGTAAEIQRIKDRFNKLRQKPYFPLSRFGEHIVSVKATKMIRVKGVLYQPGETMHFETFDTKWALMAEVDRIRGAYPSGDLKIDKVSEDIASLMSMPLPILEALKSNKDIALTAEQKKALDEYMYKIAPGQSFVKHLIQRKGVEGYTEDVQRAYANYFFHGASHLARIKHAEALSDEVKATHITADLITEDSSKRRAIANYMARHFKYIMSPENDWSGLRANIAVAYLAGVMKTAFVNLTQVPLVTYPHLAARYGDAKAIRALQKAYGDTAAMYHVTKNLTKEEEEAITRWSQGVQPLPGDEKIVKQWSKLASPERTMLRQAVAEGWIDESMAMELAAMSEGSWLTRFKATNKAGYFWRSFQFYSMIPFQAAEKLNRRVTAIAAFRLAVESGAAFDQAYEAARGAVSASQYEYAKWNRPEMLRGKKGVLFMFWQYMLNTLYFAFGGDKGWWRWWLLMLAAAGPMGLPFAENLKDLATWIGQKIVGPNERFNAEYELKKLAGELGEYLGVKPDLLMHGLSRYGFGILPFADLSGSLSMGRPIPGTDILASAGNDFKDIVTQGLKEAGGATTSLAMRMLQAAVVDDPDHLRRIERGMPITFVQQMLAMGRWYRDGAVESSTGADIVKFDTNDPWQLAEMGGKALGFTPQRVNAVREEHWLKQDFTNFYRLRRQMLMGKLDHEFEKGDNESVGQVIDAIRQFNNDAPSAALAITSDQIKSMRLNRLKARTLTEQGDAPQKMFQDLQRGVGERRY